MRTRILASAVAALVVIGLGLSACSAETPVPLASTPPAAGTTGPVPSSVASSAPGAAPSASATDATPEIAVRPPAVFDGDCGRVFPPSVVSRAVGAKAVVTPLSGDARQSGALEQAGAVECFWHDTSYMAGISVVVIPVASPVPPQQPLCGASEPEEGGNWHCSIEHSLNGIRLSGSVWTSKGGVGAARSAADAMVAAFDSTATADESVPVPVAQRGAWSNPVDCAGLANSVDVGEFFASPPQFEQFDGGSDALPAPALRELWGNAWGLTCYWGTPVQLTSKQLAKGMVSGFAVTVVGGGAWVQNEIASLPGATDIHVEGFDRAIRIDNGSGNATIDLFSGVNRLSFIGPESSSALKALSAIGKALSATNS